MLFVNGSHVRAHARGVSVLYDQQARSVEGRRSRISGLQRIRTERPSEQEVKDVKAYLLGSQLLRFTTDAGIASELLSVERHKLGFDYLEDYRKGVSAVTPEDVQGAARKYLDPKRMRLIAAGAVDETGKPIPKAPPPKR